MIAALVLAAGRGARFAGGANKLLVEIDGRPLLRRSVVAALASRAGRTIVVTGFDQARVEAALAGLPVSLIHNPDFAEGMASSLRTGLARTGDATGVLVLLGDMPNIARHTLNRLIDSFERSGADAVIPTHRGQRGNPVLLGSALFPLLAELKGDAGARALLRARENIVELEVDDAGVLADVDTVQDLARLRAQV